MVDTALTALSPQLAKLYAPTGRPSIALEKLLRALLLKVLYSLRSEWWKDTLIREGWASAAYLRGVGTRQSLSTLVVP